MIVRAVLADAGVGALVPLSEGDLAAADRKRPPDHDRMFRLLIGRVVRTHREVPRGDHHEFGAGLAIAKDFSGIETGLVALRHDGI
jgi:hypothetical protein